jgi:hypothetical protein
MDSVGRTQGIDAMEIIILLVVVGAAVFLSIVATWMVRRSVALTRSQKAAQIILAWVIPFLGATAVIVILTDPKDRERRRARVNTGGEAESSGGYFGGEGGHHGGHGGGHGGDAGHGGDGGGHGGDGGGGH